MKLELPLEEARGSWVVCEAVIYLLHLWVDLAKAKEGLVKPWLVLIRPTRLCAGNVAQDALSFAAGVSPSQDPSCRRPTERYLTSYGAPSVPSFHKHYRHQHQINIESTSTSTSLHVPSSNTPNIISPLLPNNTLYLASGRLTFVDAAGSGVLDYRDDRVLTAPGLAQSRWRLLDWMNAASISYHTQSSIKDGYFQSAAKGQEFVVEGGPLIRDWAESLILH